MRLAIVIPFYNEEKNLIKVIREWNGFNMGKKYNSKVIFINDNSSDNSIEVIKKNINSKYEIITTNSIGAGNACYIGYQAAVNQNFDIILQIDSDGQCSYEYLEKFLINIEDDETDIVIGHRHIREDGITRLITSKALSYLIFLFYGFYINDANCPYRLIKKDILKKIIDEIESKNNYKEIYLKNILMTFISKKNNYRIKFNKIIFKKRYYGKSNYNYIKMIKIFTQFLIKTRFN